MSIYTLKRKTLNGNPRLAPISGTGQGPLGFALNGTRRIIGIVGHTNLGPRGTSKIGVRESCCEDQETTVKLSVKNTKGMLSKRYSKILNGTYPCSVVKLKPTDEQDYIDKLHALNVCVYPTEKYEEKNNIIKNKNCTCPHVIQKIVYSKDGKGAMSQSDYITGKYLRENSYLDKSCPPPPCDPKNCWKAARPKYVNNTCV